MHNDVEGQHQNASRLQRHREYVAAKGFKRIEVNVPETDAELIRSLAALLQAGGEAAYEARNRILSAMPPREQSIVDFFRFSPLAEAADEISFSRDQDAGDAPSFE